MNDGTGNRPDSDVPNLQSSNDILIVEDSAALSALLRQRLERETTGRTFCCASLAQARALLTAQKFTMAVTGLNLPDAPNGEILGLLAEHGVPTIVFTATSDTETSTRYAERKIIDYIVKSDNRTVDTVVKTVNRILTNSAFSVLVVDDARSARSGLVEIMQRQNFRVLEALSGKQALDILARNPSIELVITDYHMPDMDGHELTRRIRVTRPSDELRIIGVSSSSDRRLSASFLKAGASDFIYRPFVPEELQCRIDNNVETLTQLKRLRYLAERDHLTGLANRRFFFEKNPLLQPAPASDAVAILDIDHFKSVNDTYGHEAGDQVLKRLAGILSEMTAENRYLAARLGGEEFAVYMKDTNAFQAHSFCEQMRSRIQATSIPVQDKDISVTISIGVMEMEERETFGNQLNAADQLLYMAKKNGRNRVYSSLTIPEALIPQAN
ncbi:GGDEF domain-containing response regulator [Neorhizobium galegae]|uniref:GGDEF domain-containing response regulator n=1 Tax=Neorhizobium galegae TaxID=399 RepID=UPI0006221932|nr:diguanylate cyclase [Neorhizobium galegae]CDZ52369.1 Response regulator/GGDEF domain-containing protein [Neorhizobium galegae bv. orientalis]